MKAPEKGRKKEKKNHYLPAYEDGTDRVFQNIGI
jgi:hypothetical protein